MDSSRRDIFTNVQAVMDAGGLHGFVSEVIAEARTTANARIQNGNALSVEDAADDVLGSIIHRRLRDDVKAEAERYIARRVTPGHECSTSDLDEIRNDATQVALERAEQWADAIMQAVCERCRSLDK